MSTQEPLLFEFIKGISTGLPEAIATIITPQVPAPAAMASNVLPGAIIGGSAIVSALITVLLPLYLQGNLSNLALPAMAATRVYNPLPS